MPWIVLFADQAAAGAESPPAESELTVLALLLAVSAGLAVAAWRRFKTSGVLLPAAPRRPVPWNGTDVTIVLLSWLALQLLLPVLLLELKGVRLGTSDLSSIEVMAPFLAADSVTQVIALMAAIGILMSRCGATWQDLGFDGSHWTADCRLGFVAFWLIVPPVLTLQVVLTAYWDSTPQPLAKMLLADPQPILMAIAAWRAVIVAPLVEEFFVRVVLQGWLEAVVARRIAETPSAAPGRVERWAAAMPWLVGATPVLLSAGVFSLMHLGQGPAPIPLFFLALGLGYLYRQTHRILPSLTVHTLLNGMSMVELCIMLVNSTK